MKYVLLLFAVLSVLVVIIAVIGALLPRAHVVSRSATFRKTPAELYAVARDFANAPTWRPDVKKTELLEPRNGKPRHRETTSYGVITYCVEEDEPGAKLVTRIADEDLPSWKLDVRVSARRRRRSSANHGTR